jgi:rhodanese-related sulfurtransferase/rubrerythrin
VRSYLDEHEAGTFTLLDVRQPEEYARMHLPGALLIPVGELHDRMDELDPSLTTIVYCASGGRAGTATGLLRNAGFHDAWNMTGGMTAWQGIAASGPPEAGMSIFEGTEDVADVISLAWALEDGAREFYVAMAEQYAEEPAGKLFGSLSKAEAHHKASLQKLYADLTGKDVDPPRPEGLKPTMEGGVPLAAALDWAKGKPAKDAIELAVSVEVNAYDRYLKVATARDDEESKDVLMKVARDEKAHLERLVAAYTQRIS